MNNLVDAELNGLFSFAYEIRARIHLYVSIDPPGPYDL